MASWIKQQYKPFVQMCSGLYDTPSKSVGSYKLIEELTSSRIAVYNDGNTNVVVLRGTSLHKDDSSKDLVDDFKIATSLGKTGLESEGQTVVDKLSGKIILTGHSLGGYAALKLAKSNSLECCVFNPGTNPNNPLTDGPGSKGIAYHIVGDVISAFISDKACEVVRINLGLSPFDTLYAHSIDRFKGGDEDYGTMTADEEDAIYKGTQALIMTGINVVGNASPAVGDLLGNIMPSLDHDIPDIDEDAVFGVLQFLGIAALGPGLMAFMKGKTRKQKLQAIVSTMSDQKVQSLLKEKGSALMESLKKAKATVSKVSTDLMDKFRKSKQFKPAVQIPKEIKKDEATKLFVKSKATMGVDKKKFSKGAAKFSSKPPSYFEATLDDALPLYQKEDNPPAYSEGKKRPKGVPASGVKLPDIPKRSSSKASLGKRKSSVNLMSFEEPLARGKPFVRQPPPIPKGVKPYEAPPAAYKKRTFAQDMRLIWNIPDKKYKPPKTTEKALAKQLAKATKESLAKANAKRPSLVSKPVLPPIKTKTPFTMKKVLPPILSKSTPVAARPVGVPSNAIKLPTIPSKISTSRTSVVSRPSIASRSSSVSSLGSRSSLIKKPTVTKKVAPVKSIFKSFFKK